MKLKPSTYQTAIIKAVEENLTKPIKNGIAVNAIAGSGKSTLLVMIANILKRYGIRPEEVAVLAFGNKNKADLSKKFQEKLGIEWSESVRTIHSLGYQLYRDALFVRHKLVKIQDWKYVRIAERKGWMTDKNGFVGKLVESDIPAIRDEQEFIRLLELLRLYCYEPTAENVAALNREYRLSIINNEVVVRAAKECLEAGEDEAIFRYIIDRVDMCYLPWKQKDNSPFSDAIAKLRRQLKVIMVDESQDTDQLQIELIASLIEPGQSFIIAVGDRYQSVYYFRGCLNNGMEILGKRFNCINFDLPINYRCGQVHLELVREIFPHIHILARPDAPTGEIRVISNKDLLKCFSAHKTGYIGISRRNSALVSTAMQLLAAGKPAKIKDEKLGRHLEYRIKRILKGQEYNSISFTQIVDCYREESRKTLEKFSDSEIRIGEVEDTLGAILALYEQYKPLTLDSWKKIVNQIFDESSSCPIELYTVHSGKGAEQKIAVLLYPEEMPIAYRQKPAEEREQEDHLIYVSLTRVLANSSDESGILYLVLREREDGVMFPSWLPKKYCQLWDFN